MKILYASFLTNDFTTNGTTNGRNVVLCSNTKFNMFTDGSEEEDPEPIPYTLVKFKKQLIDVFLDTDDYDLSEFGIPSEFQDKAYQEINEFDGPYPIVHLLKYGLGQNEMYSWYGCYVNSINPSEIVSTIGVKP